jgi:hypothetical protein
MVEKNKKVSIINYKIQLYIKFIQLNTSNSINVMLVNTRTDLNLLIFHHEY